MRPGIIPARAGFTLVRLLTCALDGDHPRSRGVYDHPQTRLLRRDGSSPLARGLRSPVKLKAEFIRIIPARAGFTRAGDCSGAQCRDHPRSRGVYAVPWDCGTIVSGSSPLARGLRRTSAPNNGPSGIIPARAGFTILLFTLEVCRGDHPRSRGVYSPSPETCPDRAGSSPLARGLPTPGSHCFYPNRIIPARAGFTLLSAPLEHSARDHPRSRGVYRPLSSWSARYMGSSPLARGLRYGVDGLDLAGGIIPARAGFTLTITWPDGTEEGSSPLARGLP